MSVGIVIVTHGATGEAMAREAGFVLGQACDEIVCVAVDQSRDLEDCKNEIRQSLESADSGDGVIVLTDLMGASPANLAASILEEHHAIMVTGINLGMLIRVCNYRNQTLEQLVQKAVEGGRRAVKIVQK